MTCSPEPPNNHVAVTPVQRVPFSPPVSAVAGFSYSPALNWKSDLEINVCRDSSNHSHHSFTDLTSYIVTVTFLKQSWINVSPCFMKCSPQCGMVWWALLTSNIFPTTTARLRSRGCVVCRQYTSWLLSKYLKHVVGQWTNFLHCHY